MTKPKAIFASDQRVTEVEFCAWIGQAEPGDTIAYHRGFLVLDTSPHSRGMSEAERRELALVARRAWWAAERSLIHLVQRRHGPEDFSYLAVARPKAREAAAQLAALPLAEAA